MVAAGADGLTRNLLFLFAAKSKRMPSLECMSFHHSFDSRFAQAQEYTFRVPSSIFKSVIAVACDILTAVGVVRVNP